MRRPLALCLCGAVLCVCQFQCGVCCVVQAGGVCFVVFLGRPPSLRVCNCNMWWMELLWGWWRYVCVEVCGLSRTICLVRGGGVGG